MFGDFAMTKSVGRAADVCIESLAPSSVDYKFVRQFVGERDRRRARAGSKPSNGSTAFS